MWCGVAELDCLNVVCGWPAGGSKAHVRGIACRFDAMPRARDEQKTTCPPTKSRPNRGKVSCALQFELTNHNVECHIKHSSIVIGQFK